MDTAQSLFNVAVGVAGAVGGWWMKAIWEALRDLQSADQALAGKVSSIEVLVAGTYVTRDELSRTIIAMMGKLDRIEDKLDLKVDKSSRTQ